MEQSDDSKRTLKSIDTASVNQIFSLFKIQDPGCDKDSNGLVEGDELKCLGKLWKYYLPKWFTFNYFLFLSITNTTLNEKI